MSAIKQNTIEILNQLIPQLCPEEQEIFDIHSDTFYEQAISNEDHNKLGDGQYFGEAIELNSQFLLGCLVTVIVEAGFRASGKYCWKHLSETYQKNKPKPKSPQQAELVSKLEQALKEKSIAQEQVEKLNDETSKVLAQSLSKKI